MRFMRPRSDIKVGVGTHKMGFNGYSPVAVPDNRLRGIDAIWDFLRFLAQSGALEVPFETFSLAYEGDR